MNINPVSCSPLMSFKATLKRYPDSEKKEELNKKLEKLTKKTPHYQLNVYDQDDKGYNMVLVYNPNSKKMIKGTFNLKNQSDDKKVESLSAIMYYLIAKDRHSYTKSSIDKTYEDSSRLNNDNFKHAAVKMFNAGLMSPVESKYVAKQ